MAGRVRQVFVLVLTLGAMLGTMLVAVPMLIEPGRATQASATTGTTAYLPVGPVRLADTRDATCGCSRTSPSAIRVAIAGRAGVPDDVAAVAITVTALQTASDAFVTAYPSGMPRPLASTVNTRTDRVTSNSTIVPVGADGAIELFHLVPGDLVVDVTGAFVPSASTSAGRFVSVATRRLVDTREPNGSGAPLGRNGDVTVPLPEGVDRDATAVVVNVTSVGDPAPGFLSARPAGARSTSTSFLNLDGSGQATAASVIVPVSADGFTVRSLAGGHIIVDLTGWFTGASAEESTLGLFHPLPPSRLLDTRLDPPRVHPHGAIEVPVPVVGAASVVTNVTVTNADRAGFVAAFPAGTPRPGTSAVNPAFWNHTVANTAITRVSDRGLAYWSLAGTDLVIDISGWFVGEPVAAAQPPSPNEPERSRVFIVGDSTLRGIDVYTDSQRAFHQFDAVVDAKSCRRLLRPSCTSSDSGRIEPTAVEAIRDVPGPIDVVVVKSGYNDWYSDFPGEFDAVVTMARARGAHTILWLNQNERVGRERARRAYEENNADLRWLSTLPQYSDVIFGDWFRYSDARQDWFHDGTHVNRSGAFATTDYIARWLAALDHRRCHAPQVVGGAVSTPCHSPDATGPVPDPIAVNP